MNNLKQWFGERKIIYHILSLFYDGRIDEGLQILNKSYLLYSFQSYSENKQISNGASEIIKEMNENKDSDYKTAISEEYQRLFVGPNELLAPLWESVYKTKDKLLFGDIELEVRRYYNSSGLDVKASEAADYLPLILSFMSRLCTINKEDNLENVSDKSQLKSINENLIKQKDFLNRHLLSWITLWAEDVNKNAEVQFWRGFAKITEGWLKNDLMEIEELCSKNANFLSVRR